MSTSRHVWGVPGGAPCHSRAGLSLGLAAISTKPSPHTPRPPCCPSPPLGGQGKGWEEQEDAQGEVHSCSVPSTSSLLPSTFQLPVTAPAFPAQTGEQLSPRCRCGSTRTWGGRTQLPKPLNEQEKPSRQGDAGRRPHSTEEPSGPLTSPWQAWPGGRVGWELQPPPAPAATPRKRLYPPEPICQGWLPFQGHPSGA